MALYIDKPERRTLQGRLRWTAHLISDASIDELHAFAAGLQLPTKAFHNKPGRPHYDLLDEWVGYALAVGAKPVTSRQLLRLLVQQYGN